MLVPTLVFALTCIAYAAFGGRIARRDDALARLVGDLAPLAVTFIGALLLSTLFSDLVHAHPRPDHLLRLAAGAALPMLVVALVPRRLQPVASGVVLAGLALLLLADLVYWRFFGSLLPLVAAGGAGMLVDVVDSVAEVMRSDDVLLALPVVGGLALAIRCPRPQRSIALPGSRAITIRAIAVAAGLGCVTGLFVDTALWLERPRSMRVLSSLTQISAGGPITAHIREVARVSREQSHDTLSEAEVDEVVDFFRHKVEAREHYQGRGALAGSNVLLVQVEGMQQYAVDISLMGERVMPFVHSLAERGLVYDNVYDLTGESLTSDCGYMVLNSLPPLRQGAVAFRRSNNRFTTIAHVVAEHGYATLSAHGYRKGMWNRAVLHPRYGFQRSFFREELGGQPRIGWGLSDEAFFEKMVPILRDAERPFFAFLITLTSHHPFRYIPADRRELDLGNGNAFSGYLHSMRYVDDALRQLFQRLDASGLLDDTAVVIYGDHDSRLELAGGPLKIARRQTSLTADELMFLRSRGFATDKIPLVVIPPAKSALAPAVISTAGGQVDIAPTILHHLGIDAPASFVGEPLVPERAGHAYRVDGCAVADGLLAGGPNEAVSCLVLPLGPPVPDSRCAALVERAEHETTLSLRATFHDLAHVINERVVVPAMGPPLADP